MSPPIFTPDGSEVSEIVLPDGSTASEVIDPDGNVVFEAGPDIPDSGISRYLFNDTADSRVAVDSWGDNSGTISNGSYSSQSYEGSHALNLNGDGYVDISGVLPLGDTFTIAGAAYHDSTDPTSRQTIFACGNGSYYYFNVRFTDDGDGQIELSSYDGNFSNTITSNDYADGSYHYYVLVVDTNEATLHIDDTETISLSLGDVTQSQLVVGADYDLDGYEYIGRIDDVPLYSKALTDTDVSNLTSTGSIGG